MHEFCRRHADARLWIEAWTAEVEDAKWEKTQDVKDRYSSASFLHDNLIVFNVKGNRYRMVVSVSYPNEVVLVRRIGTHREYDRWNLEGEMT